MQLPVQLAAHCGDSVDWGHSLEVMLEVKQTGWSPFFIRDFPFLVNGVLLNLEVLGLTSHENTSTLFRTSLSSKGYLCKRNESSLTTDILLLTEFRSLLR